MKIGNLLKSRVFLAPMAGITNLALRLQCLKYGAGMVTVPMINAIAVTRQDPSTWNLLKSAPEEKPRAVQIFGSEARTMGRAAGLIADNVAADMIDINAGCPVRNIMEQGAGAALLRNPLKLIEIVESVKGAVDVGVSVKMRIARPQESIRIAALIEKAGADMITVHGRTAEQGYSGIANHEVIQRIGEALSIRVVGNGDIKDEASAERMFEKTGCDAIMIGRAADGQPQIFEKIIHYLNTGTRSDKTYDKMADFDEYCRLSEKFGHTIQEIRQYAFNLTKEHEGGARIRDKISRLCSAEEIREALNSVNS
ncbi:MAG: tRNA-dihydrouridine synthase family protein [archaeon]